ncbi:RdgB/HAM1 family non-canonical purine NTP pyrophosphatase [Thiomicrospira sp. ALE5]|uniref:RdgB/HAM1 family non-canonical purine NTP pyrophosphatase n=1 Tax=Thiomicrospira sp. ALE5 TaxID=748650 RepID=UPI0008EC2E0F|nr:RdgB/HAM1 family non-canonical purine NTP pyrophosphatase [Thiomicrospira sp. ALE5]SFR55675.1 XTP/dITP diphosphohydrolase [Thiomicrospira sp. ALE5]
MPRLRSQPSRPKPVAYSRNRAIVRKACASLDNASANQNSKLEVVLATGNANKAAEVIPHVTDISLVLQSAFSVSSIEETGHTLLENAILKARHACEQTGLPAIGDDSGLFVAELGQLPGLYSARFAGEGASDKQNCEKLLTLAASLKGEQRRASYISTVVFMRHAADPLPITVTREWSGYLSESLDGQNGYGYDAIFYVPEFGMTAAQLTDDQKLTLSNRLEAFKALVPQIIKQRR